MLGTILLVNQVTSYRDILQMDFAALALFIFTHQFYEKIVLPDFQKIVFYLEQAEDIESIKLLMPIYIAIISLPLVLFFSTQNGAQDPLISSFPHLAKYATFESLRGYFDKRFAFLPSRDKAYQWVDLCCRAAEIVAPTDRNKALGYLAKAQKEVESQLWHYCFSPDSAAIKQKRREALARLATTRADILN